MIILIGYFAAFFTTASSLPQAYKTLKTQNTDGLSFLYFAFLDFGILLWAIYGTLINDMPLMITNYTSFIIISSILVVILKNYYINSKKLKN